MRLPAPSDMTRKLRLSGVEVNSVGRLNYRDNGISYVFDTARAATEFAEQVEAKTGHRTVVRYDHVTVCPDE